MHKQSSTLRQPRQTRRQTRTRLSATHVVRAARRSDAGAIHGLLQPFVDQGLLLPRSVGDLRATAKDFVLVQDADQRIVACASLVMYSSALAEVAAVAVSAEAQGLGLGSMAVQAVEAAARRRGVQRLFAMTLAERFFESLGYESAALAEFPLKLAAYADLRARGIAITPKACYARTLND